MLHYGYQFFFTDTSIPPTTRSRKLDYSRWYARIIFHLCLLVYSTSLNIRKTLLLWISVRRLKYFRFIGRVSVRCKGNCLYKPTHTPEITSGALVPVRHRLRKFYGPLCRWAQVSILQSKKNKKNLTRATTYAKAPTGHHWRLHLCLRLIMVLSSQYHNPKLETEKWQLKVSRFGPAQWLFNGVNL